MQALSCFWCRALHFIFLSIILATAERKIVALRRFESTKPLEGNGYLVMGTEESFLQKSHISSSLSVPVHPGWE